MGYWNENWDWSSQVAGSSGTNVGVTSTFAVLTVLEFKNRPTKKPAADKTIRTEIAITRILLFMIKSIIMQGALISIVFVFFLLLNGGNAYAAKKFVPKANPGASGGKSGSVIPIRVSYRNDKRALNFYFTNFSGITSASYVFSYDTNGTTQGAAGSVTAANNPNQSRELLFGTCSTSVCTYHSGLKNAKLTFTINYTNGRRASKIFRVKTYF